MTTAGFGLAADNPGRRRRSDVITITVAPGSEQSAPQHSGVVFAAVVAASAIQ